ncbi:hypothetical protein BYT27DRAFT_7342791 [Phlegmacium glaucopus]|nr:hypothetical protein BYT27DRAFT_7342791 [Phlegmacium glaucopus]
MPPIPAPLGPRQSSILVLPPYPVMRQHHDHQSKHPSSVGLAIGQNSLLHLWVQTSLSWSLTSLSGTLHAMIKDSKIYAQKFRVLEARAIDLASHLAVQARPSSYWLPASNQPGWPQHYGRLAETGSIKDPSGLADLSLRCHVKPTSFSPLRRSVRAFTRFCQAYIFKVLHLHSWGTKNSVSKKLEKIKKILNDEPSFANRVRTIRFTIGYKRNGWIFNDLTFINILQLLAKSPMPPHELQLYGWARTFRFEDPALVVGRLMQSFFSETLTVLHLVECKNIPLTLFLICPRLREIHLDVVEATRDYDEYPDNQCSGRELPALEYLSYLDSVSLVKQMITPPSRFHTSVVFWSKLRVLKLCPREKKELACLQPILDVACNTLEELVSQQEEQLPLSGLVNLRDLSYLHVFALYVIIKCDVPESAVVRDVNLVLNTIPTSNQVMNLSFYFSIRGEHPFGGCLEEDWVGLCDEIVRISAGKPLNLELETSALPHRFRCPFREEESPNPLPGQDELYDRIMERISSLSDHPNICTRFWHPARSDTCRLL